MLCGIKCSTLISFTNAIKICKKFNLKTGKGYQTKKECWISDDNPNTWKRTGKYRHLFIDVKKEANRRYRLTIRGSLHKFYKGENTGTFTGKEVIAAIYEMCRLFTVHPSELTVKYIEVGINLPVWFLVYPYLKANLIYHKKTVRADMNDDGDGGKAIGFKFRYDDYLIKLYQKANHVFRFEVKYQTKEKLEPFGIRSVADLTEATVNKLAFSLLMEWKEVVITNGIDVLNEKGNPNGLTEKERRKLYKYSSSIYQQNYEKALLDATKKGDAKKKEALRIAAHRLKRECLAIIYEKGDHMHSRLEQMIAEGVEEFMNTW